MIGKYTTTTDSDERGQVGIGTLIVFIAMVLVAAIAAGVLINTAGVLQTQASDTGSETQEQVANQIEVLHASGDVDEDTGTIDTVDMTLMKSAGSNEIDLRSMTAQYTSSSTDETLTYGDEANASVFATSELSGDNDGESLTTKDDRVELSLNTSLLESGDGEGTIELNESTPTVSDVSVGTNPVEGGDLVFTVTDDDNDSIEADEIRINNTDGDDDIASISDPSEGDEIRVDGDDFSNGDVLEAVYNPDSDDVAGDQEVTVDEPQGLAPGSSATVALVDQSGAQFTYGISVPSTFGTSSVVEV